MGAGETTLVERVETSSFVAASERLPVHLSSSTITACPGETRTTTKSSNVLVQEPEQVESDTDESVLDLNERLKVELKNDNVQSFCT